MPKAFSRLHPASVISTWWFSGLLPWAPGTWGSFFTLPFAWLIADSWGNSILFIAAGVAFVIGLWASHVFLRQTDQKDPNVIVIDEVAGQFLTLAVAPVEFWWYLCGFVIFRAADIIKPWPASWVDKSLSGSFGVMLDDTIAAVYAAIVLYIVTIIIG